MNYRTALDIAERAMRDLAPFCERIAIAGSVRRKAPDCGDIELVYVLKDDGMFGNPNEDALWQAITRWTVEKGHRTGLYIKARLPEAVDLDLFRARRFNYGLQLAIRTGPAGYSHSVLARTWARKGYHSEHGVLYPIVHTMTNPDSEEDILDRAHPVYLRDEDEVFRFLGMSWVAPEARG